MMRCKNTSIIQIIIALLEMFLGNGIITIFIITLNNLEKYTQLKYQKLTNGMEREMIFQHHFIVLNIKNGYKQTMKSLIISLDMFHS